MEIMQSKISQNMDFRTKLGKYIGIKAIKKENEWYWNIEEPKIDWNRLKAELASNYPEEIERLENLLTPTKIEKFEQLFTEISTTITFPKKKYRVEGDIRKVYKVNKYYIFTMIDNQNLNQIIRIKIPIGKIPPQEFEDRRVIVTGRLEIYPPYAQFQLVSDETQIKDIGVCSRKRKLLEWTEELKDILNTGKKPIEFKPVCRIGVIGKKESHGLTDFINHRSEKAKKNIDYDFKLVEKYEPLTIDAIQKYLEDYNAETINPCDYICIIRGGDDPEKLLQFSQPKFVRAIASSKIPVITGIAHDKDKIELLCDQVTDLNNLNGGTPTGAAEILNKFIGHEEKRKRESECKQNLERIRKKAISDKQQIALLEEECKRLRTDLDEAQDTILQLRDQLKKPKKTGILSFLFGTQESENSDEAARLAKRVRELYAENQQLKAEKWR